MTRATGPDAVRTALVEATARLLGERSPAAVSVRDIATEAGVNHGLVHRYFGSKDALVRAALRARAASSVDQLTEVRSTEDLLARLRTAAADPHAGWRLLARSLLDGFGEELGREGEFHGVARLVDGWRRAQAAGLVRTDIPAEDLARVMLATALGWLQFHEYIAASTRTDTDALDEIARALAVLVAPTNSE